MAANTVLLDGIAARRLRIGIIGLGSVGLPLAVEFANAGFTVTGFDVDERKNAEINAGRSSIPDMSPSELESVVKAGRLSA